MTDDRLLTVAEVAQRLRWDPSTVRRRIQAGDLAAKRPGGHYRVSERELDRFIASSEVVPEPEPPRPPRRSSAGAAPAPPTPPPGSAPGGSFRARRRREAA